MMHSDLFSKLNINYTPHVGICTQVWLVDVAWEIWWSFLNTPHPYLVPILFSPVHPYCTFYLIFQKFFMCFYKWGKPEWAPHWSWQRPVRNMLSIYVCIIYPAFAAPWFPRSVYALKCSVYFGILTCSRAALNWTARTTGATRVYRQNYKTGRGMRRHMV